MQLISESTGHIFQQSIFLAKYFKQVLASLQQDFRNWHFNVTCYL